MYVTCLDLEGVLVPEIWIAFAKSTGIPEFKKTTRDEPDYDKLMQYRINLLNEHGLGLKEIRDVIATIDPLPGAKEFLDDLLWYKNNIDVKDEALLLLNELVELVQYAIINNVDLLVAKDEDA